MNKYASKISLLLAVCSLYAAAQMPAPAPVTPAPAEKTTHQPDFSLTSGKDWQNPQTLRSELSAKILKRLKGNDEHSIKSFLKSEYNRLLLANWQLVHAEILSESAYQEYQKIQESLLSAKKRTLEAIAQELPELTGTAAESSRYRMDKLNREIAEIEDELRQPMRMADVAKRPRASRLITLMANDLGWIGDVVYSGECIMPGRMLNMLANMMERYTRMLPDDRMPRDIATATALEYARFGWTVNNACERAEYFVRNWRRDRLHRAFDTLPFWQRRVVCGWKGDHSSGKPESLNWALTHVHLNAERYTGCCWRCGYVLNNVYGDGVQGADYGAPFEGMYTDNHHKYTQEVGGVCGGLSHFGASAACANGIPGLTMGEPGHCAFVVLVDGKWTPAYSLTWDRGLHWRPWMDNWAYSSLQLTTDLYSKEQRKATRLSNAYRVLAHLHSTKGETDQAIAYFLSAAKAQPLNYPVYREHAELLKANKAKDATAWLQLNESVCRNLVPLYAECASTVMRSHVYDGLCESGATAEQQLQAFSLFWKNLRELGPDRWKVQELMDKQIALLNQSRPDHKTDNMGDIFRSMMSHAISHEVYSTIALECGNNLLKAQDKAGKALVLNIMTTCISNGESMSHEARTKALGNAVLATEAMRDAGAFQSVSSLIDPALTHVNRPIGDFEAFPGKLVSEGGVVFASSTSQWDKPTTHANILTKRGGLIHTANNNAPWVAVKLPKHATISGIVIAAEENQESWYRLHNLQVQISETGKDDDWHDVGSPTGNCQQRLIRIDLTAEQPTALYVRVIRPDTHDVLHLDGFFVYGTPAA